MIQDKNDLKRYLDRDRIALNHINEKRPHFYGDEIWKYEILLRKVEYYINCKKGLWMAVLCKWYRFRFHNASVRLGFTISPNVFGPGLSLAHYGAVVVHANAKVGENCRIHEGVTIGATGGSHKAAVIGKNCFIGSGAKIIGDIQIADDVAIGAGAVVTKDITQPGTTWAGVPAVKISDKNSHNSLCSALFDEE